MNAAWMRTLTVTLTSTKFKKKFVFGENHLKNQNDLAISVHGYKYMSSLKDSCTISISNLTYSEIVQIIDGQFYDVEVRSGYEKLGSHTIFKGYVIYISNVLNDRMTNTAVLICGSSLVARFGQSRINLSINSGINMYSALKFVCKRAGVPNSNVSQQLKKKIITEVLTTNGSAASWINRLAQSDTSLLINTDEASNSFVSIFDGTKDDSKKIILKSELFNLSGGYPQLNADGLSFFLMPTFNFSCGEVVQLDNSIINIGGGNATENRGYYLDKDGCYVVYEVEYELENRGSNFYQRLLCKSRSLVRNILGDK